MRRTISVLSMVILFVTATGWLMGQTRSTNRRTPSVGGTSRSTSQTSGWQSRGGTTSRSASSSVAVSPNRGVRGGSPISSTSSGSARITNRRYQDADRIGSTVRKYSVSYNPYGLYNLDYFYTRLWFQYGYVNRYDYLSLYAHGVSPLSTDATRLALQDATDAAMGVVQLSGRLRRLLNNYRAGEITEAEFNQGVNEALAGIETFSRFIRKDDYLNYLDLRKDQKWGSFSVAHSIEELEVLVRELEQTADQISSGIASFRNGDGVQTVSLGNLEQASFKSMTKKLDKLSKTIGRSLQRLEQG